MSHKGHRVCVRIIGTNKGLREREAERTGSKNFTIKKRGTQIQNSANSKKQENNKGMSKVLPRCQHDRFTALQVHELQAELCTGGRHS